MKVELKQIIDQLSDTLLLPKEQKVSAIIDNDDNIVGRNIVNVAEDGKLTPISKEIYTNIRDLIRRNVIEPDIE